MFTLHDILMGNPDRVTFWGTVDPAKTFCAAQHDSRRIEAGDLFIAIKGERVDGHQFLSTVAQAGAAGTLCSVPDPDLPPEFLQIIVPDTIQALQATAHARVQRQSSTLKIGITGSSGKTTIKEATAAILSRRGPTLKTYASYNNEIGYPLTLLALEEEHRYAVLEMGAERVGELSWLCDTIARPDWSLISTVGAAHLGHFGSLEQVEIAKSELVQVLESDGIALLNGDDPRVCAMAKKTSARVITYGRGEDVTVGALNIEDNGLMGNRFLLRYQYEQVPIQLHLPGQHGVTTALAAAAISCAADVPLDIIKDVLEAFVPVKGRGVMQPGPNGSRLIDDSYNAIRESIIAILKAMQMTPLKSGGKRWAILGELLEQGEHTREEHYAVGRTLVDMVDYLVAIGENARFYVEGAIHAGMPVGCIFYFPAHVTDTPEIEFAKGVIAGLLKARVGEDDLVLVKGSRGVRMETLIPLLNK